MKDSLPQLPPRDPDSHKGHYGFDLIVGGSRGMTGAVVMAGLAALRGGAGLVRLAVPDVCLDVIAGYEPSYMTVPLPADAEGRVAAEAWDKIIESCEWADVIALGPGLGLSEGLDRLVGRLYREVPKPMVVDADGLNALSTQADVLGDHADARILTPHPGEFARLTGGKVSPKSTRDEQEDAAVELASRTGTVIVLKGHRTLVTDGTERYQNTTGNPGMATGGSGDVLTGLITALCGQALSPYDAARLAVHLHGLAGDFAASEYGEVCMMASDLVDFLPDAFEEYGAG
jgi:ADP-dependent NAD(P)H-hydrate dehydratase